MLMRILKSSPTIHRSSVSRVKARADRSSRTMASKTTQSGSSHLFSAELLVEPLSPDKYRADAGTPTGAKETRLSLFGSTPRDKSLCQNSYWLLSFDTCSYLRGVALISVVKNDITKRLDADIEPAVIDIEIRCVVSGGRFRVFSFRHSSDEEKE